MWDVSLFQTRGLEIGLCYRNGGLYVGGFGTFIGDPNEVYNVFYSKSTDDGLTWTDPDGPFLGIGDWRSIPILASSPYDDWEENMSFDMFVDNSGFPHILGVLEDLDDPDADLAVVDIFKTGSGWDARFVAENLAANTLTRYGPIEMTGFHVGSAVSPDGMAMAAVWLSAQDSAGRLPDIWASTRHVSGDSWSDPVNLTATRDYAELLLQVAPILRSDGNDAYTMFLARAYQQGITTYPPDDLSPADIFAAAVPLTITPGDAGVVPCEEIDVFKAKCDSAGTAWGLVRLIHSTEYAGETVEFQLDDTVYPVELITNGTLTSGRLEVPHAGYGHHTLSLVSPGDCYDPIPFNCQAGGSGDDPEFDAIWAEFEGSDGGKPTNDVVPDRVRLIGNYPNPFNPVTTISYELPAEMHVTLSITDLIGREVTRLVDGLQTAGYKSVTFDGSNQASGIYFYRLHAGSFVETKGMLLVK